MNLEMFSSELENSNFLGSIDVLSDAYDAVLKTHMPYQLHTSPSGFQILAFNSSSPDYTTRFVNGEFDLVSSEYNKVVDFISTKVNPKFSINRAAVELFEHLSGDIKELENEVMYKPLIITGQALGGYLAILFALWLHNVKDKNELNGSKKDKRPICITFGSPPVGDEALKGAIFERPQWRSSFLNVVAKIDPFPSFFSTNGAYKPFGTYLFCTQFGRCTSFEDDDSILAVLDTMAISSAGNLQMHDYKHDLIPIQNNVLYRGVSELGEFNFNSLKAGITLQLMEVGLVDTKKSSSNDLIEKMEVKQAEMIRKSRNSYEPARKLNEMKISMVLMEIYMKTRRPTVGYYDSYKSPESKEEIEIQNEVVKHQRMLNQYWSNLVDEKNRMPQEEGFNLRKRWLYSGTNYRRIVEPLDIAEYYKKGNKNYIEKRRPNYYKLLEKWSIADKKDLNPTARTNKAASLTEDSCFWAYVEEALISLKNLMNESSNNAAAIEQGLGQFEAYLMSAINDHVVSSDIFLEESSLMKWWSEYKTYKGSSYASEFANYMNNRVYKSYL